LGVGFKGVGAAAAAAVDPHLVQVDAQLAAGGYAALHAAVDDWVVVRLADPGWVYQWRLEAEVEARRRGRPTLTDAQVAGAGHSSTSHPT